MPLEFTMLRKEETLFGALSLARKKIGNDTDRLMVERYIRENPKDPGGYIAHVLVVKGADVQNNLSLLQKGKEECEEKSLLFHVEGMMHDRNGQRAAAMVAFKHAVELDPLNHVAIMSLATLLNREQQNNEARKYWLMLVELEPTFYFAWFGLCRSAVQQRDYSRALNYINSALFTLPKSGDDPQGIPIEKSKIGYLSTRARIFQKLNKLGDALKDFETAFSLDPIYTISEMKGMVTILSNEITGADDPKIVTISRIIEKMIKLDKYCGGDLGIYFALAVSYLLLGEIEKVNALFDDAIESGLPRSQMLSFKEQAYAQVRE
ncbi:MAG: hypothetical protein Q7S22_07540 [Candidatus Micrarchaeota archaeon]|nr:hypothetical protein [Candidatus Micrarchaeota archaeon]